MEFPPSRGLDYSLPVRLGNWFEDAVIEEEQLREFLAKQAKGQLYMQRQKKMFESLLAPTQVSLSVDQFVRFADKVMLSHAGMSSAQPYYPQVLAANLGDDPLLELGFQLPAGKIASAIPLSAPTVRTTFVISGIGDELASHEGRPLTYNEPFELHTTSGNGGSLRLYSTRRTFAEFSDSIANQMVTLVQESSRYTRWRVLPLDPKRHLEMTGHRVPANQKVLLNHIFTNQNLALEWRNPFKSAYGKEYEVATRTYLDVHKCPTDANHWCFFMMSRPPSDVKPQHKTIPDETSPTENMRTLPVQEAAALYPHSQPTTPENNDTVVEKQALISSDTDGYNSQNLTEMLPLISEQADSSKTGASPPHGICPKCLWQKGS